MTTKPEREWRKKRNRELAAKVGLEVRERRHALVLTQEQLASQVRGLNASFLAKIERGEGGEKVSLAMWLDLARALGFDLDRLLHAAGVLEQE